MDYITSISQKKSCVNKWFFECSICGKKVKPMFTDSPICFNCEITMDYQTTEEVQNINAYQFYCPLCNNWQDGSHYLSTVFDGPTLWFANMITHYRHGHIKYWDNSLGYINAKLNYDKEKIKVNERAKRQIIRKASNFVEKTGLTLNNLKSLQHTDEKTIEVYNKKINNG